MFRMLVAMANAELSVGYCLEMSICGAMLLLHLAEERAFAAMRKLFSEFGIDDLFRSGFPRLHSMFRMHRKVLQVEEPEIWKQFKELEIRPGMYTTPWLMTIFCCFPYPVATRVWDVFLVHGTDLLVAASVAVVEVLRRRIVGHTQVDILRTFTNMEMMRGKGDRLMEATRRIWTRMNNTRSRIYIGKLHLEDKVGQTEAEQ